MLGYKGTIRMLQGYLLGYLLEGYHKGAYCKVTIRS